MNLRTTAPKRGVLASSVCLLISMMLSGQALGDYKKNKESDVKVSVDGNLVGVSTVTTRQADNNGSTELSPEAGFAGGDIGKTGENELTLLRAEKGGGEVRLLAQGGVVKIQCDTDPTTYKYYQKARVTLSGLGGDKSKVWAFYDPRVGAIDNKDNIRKGQPHFNAKEGYSDAWARIADKDKQIKLCDGNTPYVDGDPGVLTFGTGGDARATAGMFKSVAEGKTAAHFDVYVPMDGRLKSTTTGIVLAMGFVVRETAGAANLDDGSSDVAFEAWVSSEPWWDTLPEEISGTGGNVTDEYNQLLAVCNDSLLAESKTCILKTSGVYEKDGITRIGGASDFAAWTTQIISEDGFDAVIELAPTASRDNTGFAIPTESIVNIAISWPTDGSQFFDGGPRYGAGKGEADLSNLVADTPVKVNTSSEASATSRWTNKKIGNRVETRLTGTALSTSAAISRETWWPQCDVSFNDNGVVKSENCGADMKKSVNDRYMVFSSVPARLGVFVGERMKVIAGGLVSTNGQGFAFGRKTFADVDPAFEFTSSGPSYNSANKARTNDGFYYVCLPKAYLESVHKTTAAAAKNNWQGTRADGDTVTPLSVTFAECKCGLDDDGLVASVPQFGYSSPVFQLKAKPITAPGAPTDLPTAPAPAPATFDVGGLKYSVIDSNVKVVGQSDKKLASDIVIPETVTNNETGKVYRVTAIAISAFEDNNLKSVTIGTNVIVLEEKAFKGNKLVRVLIPASITTIGEKAFQQNKFASLNIPSSVTTIGDNAFNDNELTSVAFKGSYGTFNSDTMFAKNESLSTITYCTGAAGWSEQPFFNGQDSVKSAPISCPATVNLSGKVQTTFFFPDGGAEVVPVCAIVLASGQFMFSCDPIGPFSLNNLPREADGTVVRQIYADGFFPSVTTLAESGVETITMERAFDCKDYNPASNPLEVPASAGKVQTLSGRVLLQATDTPLCALVLANGQYMFSCGDEGAYSLEFPLDGKGQYKLQVYADGFAPAVQTFNEFDSPSDVRMARSSECQAAPPQ